jgi:dienelactone hydrolase
MKAFDLDAHAEWLAKHATVLLPKGEGPFPVVLQFHGCGGIVSMQTRYAEVARNCGFAAVIVDSLAPRRIGRREAQLTVCTLLRLRGAERAMDVLAMIHWLKSQAWAAPGRVVCAGWSHGGWSIMEAMADTRGPPARAELLKSVETVVAVYPYAGPPARTLGRGWGVNRPTVYALIGGRDAVVGSKPALRTLERLAADGLDVRTLVMPDATHCFDDDEAADPRTKYCPKLEAQAHAFYTAALLKQPLPPS